MHLYSLLAVVVLSHFAILATNAVYTNQSAALVPSSIPTPSASVISTDATANIVATSAYASMYTTGIAGVSDRLKLKTGSGGRAIGVPHKGSAGAKTNMISEAMPWLLLLVVAPALASVLQIF